MDWVEAQVRKVFIERGANDVQELGNLIKSLNFVRHDQTQLMLPLNRGSHGVAMQDSTNSHVGLFLPYLHFETAHKMQQKQNTMRQAKASKLRSPDLKKTCTRDELLMEAYLSTSATSLHPRQTLDQYFYPHTNTERRDQDQIVYRYQMRGPGRKLSPDKEPKLIMVDRLWMWILQGGGSHCDMFPPAMESTKG